MHDLFGDTITAPDTARKSLRNLAIGFAEFWAAWPQHFRKVAKKQCLDKWARFNCCECWAHIVAHVEWLKTQEDWREGRICAPLVYLNQQRWIDWTPPAIKAGPDVDPELARLRQEAKAAKGVPDAMRAKLQSLRGNHG